MKCCNMENETHKAKQTKSQECRQQQVCCRSIKFISVIQGDKLLYCYQIEVLEKKNVAPVPSLKRGGGTTHTLVIIQKSW